MSLPSRLLHALAPLALAGLVLLATTTPAIAHTAGSGPRHANDLSVYADLRQVSRDEPPLAWAVPGFLPGGDIGPDAEGLSLAGAGAVLRLAHADRRLYGLVEAGAHGHHGEASALAIEQAWLARDQGPLTVIAGRQFATLGLHNAAHGPAADFPDAGPAYRALLGEHYVDDGVALAWRASDRVSLGAAAWRGAFPAGGIGSDGNAALSAHVDASAALAGGTLLARTSLLAADADLRYDERFAPGHNHDPFTPAPELAWFTGDSTLAIASLQWTAPRATVSAEYFARDEDGRVRTLTQQADYAGTQSALALQAVVTPRAAPHLALGLRWTTLAADNRVTGPGAATIADLSGLAADGSPSEVSAVAAWRPDPRQVLRLQVSRGTDHAGGDLVLLQYAFTWTLPLPAR